MAKESKDPAVLWYSNDYLTGTSHFTRAEKGLYVDLLSYQQQKGPLTMDFIKKIAGPDFHLWDSIKEKFEQDAAGNFFNERMQKEVDRRQKYSKSRASNRQGKTHIEDMNNISKSHDEHMNNICETYEKHMEIEIETVIEKENKVKEKSEKPSGIKVEAVELEPYPTFEDFWEAYDKKVGKTKCILYWAKLKQRERELLMEHVPLYVQSTPDKTFRKDPERYLAKRGWENEIILPHQSSVGTTKFNQNGKFTADNVASGFAKIDAMFANRK